MVRKGLHIIRAMFPELKAATLCRWCGAEPKNIISYRPKLKDTQHGDYQLCTNCALRCSALEGQPPVQWFFRSDNFRAIV